MDLGSLVRRLVPGAGSPRAGTGSASTGADASVPAPALTPPITAGEWRSLPPIRPVAGPAPLVAPNAPFKAGLATAQRAPIALAALGHERRLEAPAGLTTGIAAPVQRTPAAPVPTSVRRRAGGHPASARTAAVAMRWPDDNAPEPSDENEAGGASEDVAAAAPVVARAVDAPSLVAAPAPGSRPTGLVGAAAAARPVAASPAVPALMREESPGVGVSGTTTDVGPSRPEGAPARALAPERSGPPAVARRMRLGPPIGAPGAPGVPVAPALSPRRQGPRSPAAAGAAPPVAGIQRAVETNPVPPERAPAAAPPSSADAGASPGVGPAPVAARALVAPAAAEPVVPWRPAVPARGPVSPLVGGLRPVLATDRPTAIPMPAAAEPAVGRTADVGGPTAALAALARVDPLGGATSASMPPGAGASAAGVPASAARTGSQGWGDHGRPAAWPVVAREPADDGPPFSVTESRLTWSNPWFQPEAKAPAMLAETSVTAAPGPSDGDWSTPVAGPVSSRRSPAIGAAETASGSGGFAMRPRGLRVGPAIQRRAADQGATPTASVTGRGIPEGDHAAAPPPTDWTGGPLAPVVARAATSGTSQGNSPASLAPVQRADDAAAAPAGDGTGAGAGTPGAVGAPGSPTAEKDLDDLARRLYDRIGLRLRRELLVERERSGALVDRGF